MNSPCPGPGVEDWEVRVALYRVAVTGTCTLRAVAATARQAGWRRRVAIVVCLGTMVCETCLKHAQLGYRRTGEDSSGGGTRPIFTLGRDRPVSSDVYFIPVENQ
jgi:hypothetical protein